MSLPNAYFKPYVKYRIGGLRQPSRQWWCHLVTTAWMRAWSSDWSGKEILKMKKVFILGLTAIMLFMLVGCMAGPNTLANTPDQQGRIGGLGLGIWHGFIAPVTFVVSLFNNDVHMYDVHNNGNQYNIGFILGLVLFFSVGTTGIFSRRWRR